jgi:hypothetical protein
MGDKKKNHRVERPYKYFGWDEKNPIGKYKQPIKNPDTTGSGYPQTDIDHESTLVKGRWMEGTGYKKRLDMKGAGAAERGKRFMDDDRVRSVELGKKNKS